MKSIVEYLQSGHVQTNHEAEISNENVHIKELNNHSGILTTENGAIQFTKEPVKCNAANAYEITFLSVTNAYMRNGEGSDLVNAVIDLAEKEHKDVVVRAIPLNKLIKQKDLITFYKKLGFKEDGDNHQMKYICR